MVKCARIEAAITVKYGSYMTFGELRVLPVSLKLSKHPECCSRRCVQRRQRVTSLGEKILGGCLGEERSTMLCEHKDAWKAGSTMLQMWLEDDTQLFLGLRQRAS